VTAPGAQPSTTFAAVNLPRIVFVFGKGGVGRSTVAAALGLACAARGERVLVLEWAIADPIGPWFGAAAAGPTPRPVAPRLAVANFTLDDALRAYFVDHLHLGIIYRSVIRARAVTRMLEIAPGLAEMFFLGELWWLTTLAEHERGLHFDRIIVDAPASGHGASLLDVPETLAAMPAGGLLALETNRVTSLMADPERAGSILVGLPEPLVVDETLELVPRLPREPLALIVNRSAAALGELPTRGPLAPIADELRARRVVERELRAHFTCPVVALPELPGLRPVEVVRTAARALEAA
jgi:anion-transporting  ArsA/GET3 family ATPase